MAVAKERVPANRALERIPHKDVAYAFLEVEVTGTADEFVAFRAELLEKHPDYGFAATPAKAPAKVPAKKRAAVPAGDEATVSGDESAEAPAAPEAPPAPAGTDAPKKSAADIAREKILAKRGAK